MSPLCEAVLEVLISSPRPVTAAEIAKLLHFQKKPGQLAGPLGQLHRLRLVLETRTWADRTVGHRRGGYTTYRVMTRRWVAVQQSQIEDMRQAA